MFYVIDTETGAILSKNLLESHAIYIMNDFKANGYENNLEVIEAADLWDEMGDFA